MRWIDKSHNRKDGLQNTQDFLDSYCLEPNGRHQGIRYNDKDPGGKQIFCMADNGKYRKKLTQLLLDEQKNLCCYCLRRLKTNQNEEWSDQKITLEHIIPRSYTSGSNASYYQSAQGLSSQDVELTDIYESPGYTQQTNIHPHKVAYNNLVASCNGTFPDKLNRSDGKQKLCCNLYRKELPAYPIYFHPDVSDFVDYLSDGDVQAVIGSPFESEIATLITNTNLQFISLKEIRYLWYLLRHTDEAAIYACNASKTDRDFLLGKILYGCEATDINRSVDIHQKYVKQSYWDTLILYNEFHRIMRVKFP